MCCMWASDVANWTRNAAILDLLHPVKYWRHRGYRKVLAVSYLPPARANPFIYNLVDMVAGEEA
jgi:hypothetical protein